MFLPGILMPAARRYAPLFAAIGDRRPLLAKELEVYAADEPPADYSMATEVDGLSRFADEQQLDRFHLYGHSGGASIAMLYAAANPGRVCSLALDEPATDFTVADRATIAAALPEDFDQLPVPQRMAAFARTLVRPDVELPPPAPPAGDRESAKRPAGLVAFRHAIMGDGGERHDPRRYPGPTFFSYGSLSNRRWEVMAARFEDAGAVVERYDGLHHVHTSHQAAPDRVAESLRHLWERADVNP